MYKYFVIFSPLTSCIDCILNSASKCKCFIFLILMLLVSPSVLAQVETIEVVKDRSKSLTTPENIKTMIIGNPEIAKVVALKPDTLMINASSIGSTSLTLIGKSAQSYDYLILVTHDLTLLKRHLNKIDPRIEVQSDTNGDSIILSGIAANKELIDRADEAAIRFFGTYDATLKYETAPRERAETLNPEGKKASQLPDNNKTPGQYANAYGRSGEIKANTTRVVNLIISEETLLSAPLRLKALLNQIDKRITVEEVNGVFVLNGKVATAAALGRALSISDRFVQGVGEPDFSVITDQGGVLAGNLDEKKELEVVKSSLIARTLNVAGGGANGGGGGNNGGGNATAVFNQPVMQNKGNLAQNISRGDVVMAANGRIMSLIRVDTQPRIEMQMRIIAVDRNKTDEFGIDWRLDGPNVSIGSLNGNVVGSLPSALSASGTTVDPGTANLLGFFLPGKYGISSFIKAIEEKGAGKSLSEPLLTAVSGESTSFLAGGSLPIPVQTVVAGNATSNAFSVTNVEFLEFGLSMKVRPTVLENGKISIILDQTISEPDYSQNIQILGTPIPSFKQRTVSTVTESEDGETWAIAGLLTEENTKTLRNIPFLSNLPVIGFLFQNRSQTNSRNELIITVTARRVDETNNNPINKVSEDIKPIAKPTPNKPILASPAKATAKKRDIVVTKEAPPLENQNLMQNGTVYKKTKRNAMNEISE